MPTVYPHKIVIPPICIENDKFMHVMHITNVGTEKSWYIKKGDIVTFAQPKSDTVQYMDDLGPEHKVKQHLQVRPRNWIPKAANITPIEVNKTFTQIENTVDGKNSLLTLIDLHMKNKVINKNSRSSLKSCKNEERSREVSELLTGVKSVFEGKDMQKQSENKENSRELQSSREVKENQCKDKDNNKWESMQEIVESDFLTSPVDVYPNRR